MSMETIQKFINGIKWQEVTVGLDLATSLSVLGAVLIYIYGVAREKKIERKREDARFRARHLREFIDELEKYQLAFFRMASEMTNFKKLPDNIVQTLQEFSFYLTNKGSLSMALFLDDTIKDDITRLAEYLELHWYPEFSSGFKARKIPENGNPSCVADEIGIIIKSLYEKLRKDESLIGAG